MDMNDQFKVSLCCFGNPLHGDDGLGLYVYEKLKNRLPHFPVFFFADAPLNALDVFEQSKTVLLIDAIKTEENSGNVVKLLPSDLVDQADMRPATSHLNSLPYLLQVSKHMLASPPDVEIWGVTTESFTQYSETVSRQVIQGADQLIQMLSQRFYKSHCHA